MKATELIRLLQRLGCLKVRQKGSHVRIRCGTCYTTVPLHFGEEIGPGLLRKIEKDLEPCLGERWLKKWQSTK